MHRLHEKLGPLLLQFPWFNKHEIQADEFFNRLRLFLQRGVKNLPSVRFVIEIRNKAWLIKRGKVMPEPDRMYLNPSQVVFVETVGTNSKVAQLIVQASH